MAKRVGVLMGGWGEEREISVKTGEAIATALASRGHDVTRIFAGPGLDQALRAADIDVAFLALHGRMGEDGKVQGMLEVMEIPYTGSGVMASSLAMNKPFAKKIFRLHNLPTATGYNLGKDALYDVETIHGDVGYPVVVKPACGGSSVGLSIVRGPEELAPAIAKACQFGGEALVEKLVRGKEVTVGILGDRVLGTCEISFTADTFDYQAKYKGGSKYHLPPRLSAQRVTNIELLALAAYRALGCRGYARIDLISSEGDNDVLLEVNTLPGMTQMSLLPKIAKQAGLSFEDLCEAILSSATLDDVRETPDAARPTSTVERLPDRRRPAAGMQAITP